MTQPGITNITTVLNAALNLIDSAAVSGVAGVEGSLAYYVHSVFLHHHNWERWFGLAAVPNAEIHRADSVLGPTFPAVFQIDGGNLTWGAWVQILGSSDTPYQAGMTEFDLRQLVVTATERNTPYFIQLAYGATAAGALAAGDYTEMVYSAAAGLGESPIDVMCKKIAAGTKVWARCVCPASDTGTFNFYLGLHEYPG